MRMIFNISVLSVFKCCNFWLFHRSFYDWATAMVLQSFAPVVCNILYLWFKRLCTFGLKPFPTVVLTVVHLWFERLCTCGLRCFAPLV
jgi:hypothetical protein